MAELLFSIDRIFGDYLLENQFYNIPEYQRGYKWTDKQITQLLEDLRDFETGEDKNLFYCLQNITLFSNGQNKLNVVDGQQRLTTITLLLAYLGESDRLKSKLLYNVRKPSDDFIQGVIANNDAFQKKILENNNFNTFLFKTAINENDYDYQDIYFMYQAIHTINKWFDDNAAINKISFKEKLLQNVKLIVNRIENVKEQELFINLNAGKVQLDGSDLVRAILITRVAKQEMEKFDSTEVKDIVRINERRIRIGWELDELNAWWSKRNISEYFSTFTGLNTGEKETIKFDQNKHPINLLYKIWAESLNHENGKQKYFNLKLNHFETKNTTALALYTSIILLHRTLKDWFEDREIYHYLGFLFAYKTVSFNTIWNEWNIKNQTRIQFISFLQIEFQKCIFGKEPRDKMEETGTQYWLDKIVDFDSESPTNWYETIQLEKILLSLDIIEHSQKKERGIPLPFLMPSYFRNCKEDKEHIYPGTPTQFKDFKKQNASIIGVINYIEDLNFNYEGDNIIIWNCCEPDWNIFLEDKKNEKLSELKDQIHQKRPINSIGNLVLLHLSINRGFGNNNYCNKRIAVVKNTENGEYVRQHTLKVFVKQIDNDDLSNWTMKDIRQNAKKIHDTFKIFFDFKNEEAIHE